MSLNNISNVNGNSTPSQIIIKLLWRQQQELVTKYPDCVKIIINHEDPLDIQADINGPKETPYEGGTFRVKLIVSSDFPLSAPKGIFMTKIYHPNVSEKGEICVNTLKKDWNPKGWSLYNVFEVIKCLLIIPFPESSLNQEAGKLFMEDYNEYFKIAKIFTQIYSNLQGSKSISNSSCNNQLSQRSNSDCYMMDSDSNTNYDNSLQVNYDSNNSHNIPLTNSNFISNTNSLKNKCFSDHINYDPDYLEKHREFILNEKPQLDFSLLARNPSKSVSVKYPQQLMRQNNSVFLSLNRKHSNLNNVDYNNNLLVNKPNISSLPFILRSNSFGNNENLNLVMTQSSNNNHITNVQNPTPTRSKKEEIKKWLSRI